MGGVFNIGTPSSPFGTSKPCQCSSVFSFGNRLCTRICAVSPTLKRSTGPGMPLLMVNAVTCLPAGEIVFSPIVSSCRTTAASNVHTPVTMKAVKINCLISIVSIYAHTGATKAEKFPLKNTSVQKPSEFRTRWRTQSETIDGIEMPQWRPVKIRAAISNAFGVAGGDHGDRAQRHGCRQYGRLKTIFFGRQQSLVHSRFAIAGAWRRRRFRRRFFISLGAAATGGFRSRHGLLRLARAQRVGQDQHHAHG